MQSTWRDSWISMIKDERLRAKYWREYRCVSCCEYLSIEPYEICKACLDALVKKGLNSG